MIINIVCDGREEADVLLARVGWNITRVGDSIAVEPAGPASQERDEEDGLVLEGGPISPGGACTVTRLKYGVTCHHNLGIGTSDCHTNS
jgi:hypothetical protein